MVSAFRAPANRSRVEVFRGAQRRRIPLLHVEQFYLPSVRRDVDADILLGGELYIVWTTRLAR